MQAVLLLSLRFGLILDLLAYIDFSIFWFCKSYTFTKEIYNSGCHVCIPGYLLNYLLKKKFKVISILQQLTLSSVEAGLNMVCRRADPRFGFLGSHWCSQTSRQIFLFTIRHWFLYAQQSNKPLFSSLGNYVKK